MLWYALIVATNIYMISGTIIIQGGLADLDMRKDFVEAIIQTPQFEIYDDVVYGCFSEEDLTKPTKPLRHL